MYETTAEETIEDWKTEAFFLLLCCIAAFFSAMLFALLLDPVWAFPGFFAGGVGAFLLISQKVYG